MQNLIPNNRCAPNIQHSLSTPLKQRMEHSSNDHQTSVTVSVWTTSSGFMTLRRVSGWLLLAAHAFSVKGQLETVAAGPCTVCFDGTNDITRPDYLIDLPGFPSVTCQVATTLASIVSNTTSECEQARSLGSPLCGCMLVEENPCLLCPDQSSSSSVRSIADVGTPPGAAEVVTALSGPLFDNQVAEPTCELVQAVLLNFDKESEICVASRSEANSICKCGQQGNTPSTGDESPEDETAMIADGQRCSLCPNGESISLPDREIPGFFVPTCTILDTVASALPDDSPDCFNAQQLGFFCGCPSPPPSCSLCMDGRPIPEPDALVESVVLPGNFTPTCSVFEGLAANFPERPDLCLAVQGAAIKYCGCPPLEVESCTMCPGGIPPELYSEHPRDIAHQTPVKCGVLESSQFAIAAKTELCFFLEQAAHTCGCRDFIRTYGGAESIQGQIVLAWAPRVTALLSVAGSLSILRVARQAPHTMYHQLMMSISAADVVSSVSWFMSSWPIPPVGIDAAIWGANGNHVTCKIQGVLLIGSTASHWLNFSLSLYYKLVIVNGWRERQFTTWIRVLLLGLPFIIGSTIAFVAYPYIEPSGAGCSFLPIPWATKGVLFYMLMIFPLSIAVIGVVTLTLWVCWKFSQQMRVSNKWNFSGRGREPLETECGTGSFRATLSSWTANIAQHSLEGSVLRQSIFYLLAFCASAPLALTTAVLLSYSVVNFWLSLLALIITPLQGFNNALIFFRPSIFRWCSSSFENLKTKSIRWASRSNQANDIQEHTETKNTTTEDADGLDGTRQGSVLRKLVSGPTPELDAVNNNDFDRREHQEFLRSHLRGAVNLNDEEASHDLAELEPRIRITEDEHSILVGSLTLPSFRGSSRWAGNSWEPEVSDFACDEDDVINSDEVSISG